MFQLFTYEQKNHSGGTGHKGSIDWSAILFVTDLTVLFFSAVIAAALSSAEKLWQNGVQPGHIWLIVLLEIALFLRGRTYKRGELEPPLRRFQEAAASIWEASIAFAVVVYLSIGDLPRGIPVWLATNALLASGAILISRTATGILLGKWRRARDVKRIAMAGSSFRLEQVLTALERERTGLFSIAGFIDTNPKITAELVSDGRWQKLGPLADLKSILEKNQISVMILDGNSLDAKTIQRFVSTCSQLLIPVRLIPVAFDIWTSRLTVEVVEGIPLLGFGELLIRMSINQFAKRSLDICGAVVGLLISGPIMLICAFLIKRESPGPVIYTQRRVGLNGAQFTIYKLRSMKLNADSIPGATWTTENDPRRLKIGAFLRKTNIDETPQFWNVLKGDMSLVGPRPERPEYVETFKGALQNYNLRHAAKPGLTGWAAIHGLRGSTSLADRLEYDLYYIENWSLLLDLKIILYTLMPPKNAY